MALYHLTAQLISRSAGRSAVAAAAYRSGQALTDERTGTECRYDRRQERVVHAEILTPAGASAWASDRQILWNQVEAAERRKDAQVAREIEVALPVELTSDQRLELVRDWTQRTFVAGHGLVADLSIHQDPDERNPHCHIQMTTRPLDGDGFGPKARHLNDREQLADWRASWAKAVNAALERAGHKARVDHRSLAAQGIEREPTVHEGWAARRLGVQADRVQLNIQIRERNRRLELAAATFVRQMALRDLSEQERAGAKHSKTVGEVSQTVPQAHSAPLLGRQGTVPPTEDRKHQERRSKAAERLRGALNTTVDGLWNLATLPARREAERLAEKEAEAVRLAKHEQWVADCERQKAEAARQALAERELEITRQRAETSRRMTERKQHWALLEKLWEGVDAWRDALEADPSLFRERIDADLDPHQVPARFQKAIDTSRVELPLPSPEMISEIWRYAASIQEEHQRKAEARYWFIKKARSLPDFGPEDHHRGSSGMPGRGPERQPSGRSGPSGSRGGWSR